MNRGSPILKNNPKTYQNSNLIIQNNNDNDNDNDNDNNINNNNNKNNDIEILEESRDYNTGGKKITRTEEPYYEDDGTVKIHVKEENEDGEVVEYDE